MPHVFASYIHENADSVDRLALDLYDAGIDCWTDRRIPPGRAWSKSIENAIQSGASFLACFSARAVERRDSYMYQEIEIGIEMLREMGGDRSWFVPVLFDDCTVPAIELGEGRTLRDLQWVDLSRDWCKGIEALARTVLEPLTEWQCPVSPAPSLPPLRRPPSAEAIQGWKNVWESLSSLQAAGERMFETVCPETVGNFSSALKEATEKVGENTFYFEKGDFEVLNRMLHETVTLLSGKVPLRNVVDDGRIENSRIHQIQQAIVKNITSLAGYNGLLEEMKDRYAGAGARRDASRSLEVRSNLVAKAEESRLLKVAVESIRAMLASGKLTVETECPEGHGPLHEWNGQPRCWSCGWPWTTLDRLEESFEGE